MSEPSLSPAPPPQPVREPTVSSAALVSVPDPLPAPTTAVAPTRGRIELGAAAQDFALGSDGPAVLSTEPQRGRSALVPKLLADFEPVRPVQSTPQDIRGIELIAMEDGAAVLNRLNVVARGESSAMEDLQRTLRSSNFYSQLDRLREDVREELQLDKSVTISVAGVSFGLSLVYVLWLIRGGVLMGSYLSALPAWRVLDPLPVLSRVGEEAEEDDEALDAVSERSGNPLRGFG